MAKTKHSVATHKRKKRLLKASKGFWGDRSKRFRHAKETLARSMVYAYRDRKVRKRVFRRLWIARINAACREAGMTYNRFMNGLKKANVQLDRKIISDLAINSPAAFKELIKIAKG